MKVSTAGLVPEADAATIRGEHEVQVQLLDAVQALALRGVGGEALREVFTRLEDYTRVHFLSEELLMRLYAYPAYPAHRQRHGQLLEQMAELGRSIEGGEGEHILDLAGTLRGWVVGHIAAEDAAFERYLQKPDERPA